MENKIFTKTNTDEKIILTYYEIVLTTKSTWILLLFVLFMFFFSTYIQAGVSIQLDSKQASIYQPKQVHYRIRNIISFFLLPGFCLSFLQQLEDYYLFSCN